MAGVIRNRCKMVGRLLGGWHQRIPNISVEVVDRQEMAGRWLRGWPLLFPKMSGAILDHWEMACRWMEEHLLY